MNRTILLTIFLLMNFWEQLEGQTTPDDPLVGYFANAESQLELTVKKEGKSYNGDFIFQGKSYPYKDGVRFLGALSASYEFNGGLVPFSLTGSGTDFYITSEGVTIPMVKKSGDPATAKTTVVTPVTTTAPAKTTADAKVPAATGTRYKDPAGAYSFQVPAGCTVKTTAEGFAVNCGHAGVEMTVTSHAYASTAAIKKDVYDLNDAGSGTSLKASASDFGTNGVLARYTGKVSNTPTVIETIQLVSPHGGGAGVNAKAAPEALTPAVSAILKSIAGSLQFTKAAVSAEAQQWITKLKGKQLLYFYTSSGYSEKYSYDLCVNNTFVAAGDNVYTSTDYNSNTSGATASGGSGTWKIISQQGGAALVLTFNDGKVKTMTITARSASNEVGLNGNRFFIQESTRCK